MELSLKTEYAILALLELADHHQEGEPLQIRQIASVQNIPERYLEQLLALLRRNGLIRSQRGAKGGYILGREPWQITLLDIVKCIDGLEGQKSYPDEDLKTLENIIIKEVWQEVHQVVNSVLAKYTLQDICEKRNSRKQLDMYYI